MSIERQRHMIYTRVKRRWQGASSRGFKLYPKRLSVQSLRARFVYVFRVLSRWRRACGKALSRRLKRGIAAMSRSNSTCVMKTNKSSGRRSLITNNRKTRDDISRLRSFGCPNSFYSEAIADCLEFIKSSSISDEQKPLHTDKDLW